MSAIPPPASLVHHSDEGGSVLCSCRSCVLFRRPAGGGAVQDPFSWCLGLRWGVFEGLGGGMLGAVSLDGGETRGLSEI